MWSNDVPSENTNYTLIDSIDNYDWIRIIYCTNTELQSQEIPVDVIKSRAYATNWGVSATYFGHTDGGQCDLLTYRTTCIVKFQSTIFKYTAMYNNQNLKVKPIRIYGIKY